MGSSNVKGLRTAVGVLKVFPRFCTPWSHQHLLHKPNGRSGVAALRSFLDRSKLRLVARNIFAKGSPDSLGMARTDDHAAQEFALRAVRKNINEVQRELLDVVMNHHQVTVESLQLFFVGFNLHLAGLRRLLLFFVH